MIHWRLLLKSVKHIKVNEAKKKLVKSIHGNGAEMFFSVCKCVQINMTLIHIGNERYHKVREVYYKLNEAKYTVDSRYLEVEGTLSNTSRYPYFDISDVQN